MARTFQRKGVPFTLFINDDRRARELLDQQGIVYRLASYQDTESGWETQAIRELGIGIWVNDRLDTDTRHARHVKEGGIPLVTFDDSGGGAALADLHVAALAHDEAAVPAGRRVLRGCSYLVLNEEIARCRRLRSSADRVLVTLGGSDTYGVTVKVVKMLSAMEKRATVVVGPSFAHRERLNEVAEARLFNVIGSVPSLVRLFYDFDLAVTGGGITPFEANASGLPCIIVANELFEIPNGRFLEREGGSVFAGYHDRLDGEVFDRKLDIRAMSEKGMRAVPLDGAENVFREIMSLWRSR